MATKAKKVKKYTISVVADQYGVHQQTLRLYEREGLITPSRSEKGTRYYTEEDIERLELILNLTRDLGVNLAGVSIILNMRERMNQMQSDFEKFLHYIRENISQELFSVDERSKNALVPRRKINVVEIEDSGADKSLGRNRKINVVEIKRGGRAERVE